ncbi:MAG TPA: AbrB/MazE/SpoVT family DNA-binding domain-containing protein [Candidatus Pacearchaeota archaeon]|nr:spoVT / AbrB like domain protein [archaeon BMS3Abin17]HDK42058.1 AbrB/MazE/SpoVT family DNA-binding domain-containing protein [Candidatus Pacearchaeota archaeon]HDZ61254.1 AbrB/MazE/SpoVT family DNA-binding domain-containing protein [Candidatus Pacearchaeota archaeon]
MVNISVTRISSKGQIVIPSEMRKGFKEGDKLVVIENNKQLILKRVQDFDKNIEEDLEFARRTEEAYKRHERGDFIEMDSDEFLKKMEKW